MTTPALARIALVVTLLAPATTPGIAADAAAGAEPAAATDGLDARTFARLGEALACVNLDIPDLGWDKRPVPDGFRLSRVNEALDAPLSLARHATLAEREFGADPVQAMDAAWRWLDVAEAAPGQDSGAVSRQRARLPGCPPNAREPLLALVAAFELARLHHAAAFAALDATERATLRGGLAALYVDESDDPADAAPVLALARSGHLIELRAAGMVLAQAAARALADAPALDGTRWTTHRWTVDGISIALGGPGNDRHDADIVLDAGGDDAYASGRLIVDLGGDDAYQGTAGEALLDVALIVDVAGNDRYTGGNVVQGGAVGGVSLLLDAAGDDRYEAGQLAQGAGVFGVGLLLDLSGEDSYRGARFVQGFGGVAGLGALSDVTGNDTYRAGGVFKHEPLLPENYQSLSQGFGFGLRGNDASGGIGILADHAGNDSYAAEVFGQGASYWLALGVLVDSAGHDKYDLFQYGQGAGIHLSAGVLLDRAGQDAYSCNNGVAQGSGHDWGVGLLWDLAGDDYYQGSGMSQGGSNANGIGLLFDGGGNDAYSGSRERNQGDAFPSRGTIGLGVLVDLGGSDRYTHGGRDGLTWIRGSVGVGLDAADPPAEVKP